MRDGAYTGENQFFKIEYVKIIPQDVLQIQEEKNCYSFGVKHIFSSFNSSPKLKKVIFKK